MCRNFLAGAAALAMVAGCVLAANHHELNGSWQLIPRSESVTQSGTVTIDDRPGGGTKMIVALPQHTSR